MLNTLRHCDLQQPFCRSAAGRDDLHHLDLLQPFLRWAALSHGREVMISIVEEPAAMTCLSANAAAPHSRSISARGLLEALSRSREAAFLKPKKVVRAVDGVDFDILKGETLGVVGEAVAASRPTARPADAAHCPGSGRYPVRWRNGRRRSAAGGLPPPQVQMVFQDSYASLNPRLTIEDSIAFAPRVHGVPAAEAIARPTTCCTASGLSPPLQAATRTNCPAANGSASTLQGPWRLSLGLSFSTRRFRRSTNRSRRRCSTFCWTSSGDFGLTYLFISHDLNVVRFMSRPGHGHVSRQGRRDWRPTDAIFENTRHPYSSATVGLHAKDGPVGAYARSRRFPAIRRTRSTRHPAADSTRAAHPSKASAAKNCRHLRKCRRANPLPA